MKNQFLINLLILRTNQQIPNKIDNWLLREAETMNLESVIELINY